MASGEPTPSQNLLERPITTEPSVSLKLTDDSIRKIWGIVQSPKYENTIKEMERSNNRLPFCIGYAERTGSYTPLAASPLVELKHEGKKAGKMELSLVLPQSMRKSEDRFPPLFEAKIRREAGLLGLDPRLLYVQGTKLLKRDAPGSAVSTEIAMCTPYGIKVTRLETGNTPEEPDRNSENTRESMRFGAEVVRAYLESIVGEAWTLTVAPDDPRLAEIAEPKFLGVL